MSDQIFKHFGAGVALYGDPYVIPESWQDWVKTVWANQLLATGYVAQGAPFTPLYEGWSVSWPGADGKMVSGYLNELQFPTQDTAVALAGRYGGIVLSFPFLGLGPVTTPAIARVIQFPNGETVPAFQLANYYTNNPEDKFPGVADSLCKLLIARVYQVAV